MPELKSLLDLPPELREMIYGHLFADLKPATLYIYKLIHSSQWLIRYHTAITSPPVLRACRALYFDAGEFLHKLLGAPTLLIKQIHYAPCLTIEANPSNGAPRNWLEGLPPGTAPKLRPLQYIMPILMGVKELKLVFHAASPCPRYGPWANIFYARKFRLMALLEWMSAVFAVRKTTLRKLDVILEVFCPNAAPGPAGDVLDVLVSTRAQRLHIGFGLPATGVELPAIPPVDLETDESRLRLRSKQDWTDVERSWAKLIDSCVRWPREPLSVWRCLCLLGCGEVGELRELIEDRFGRHPWP